MNSPPNPKPRYESENLDNYYYAQSVDESINHSDKIHTKESKYNWRKIFIIVAVIIIIISVIMILITIWVIAPAIAQSSINSSKLELKQTDIKNPTDTTFILSATGSVSNAGFLDAVISFPGYVALYWTNVPNNGQDVAIASFQMPSVSVSGSLPKSGIVTIADEVVTIIDPTSMSTFADFMISSQSFSWRISGPATAKAFGITFNNLKVVSLNGFGGFKNVSVDKFNLPSSIPNMGITLNSASTLFNPSEISIAALGQLDFLAYYQNVAIGSLSAKNVSIHPGPNSMNWNGFLQTKDTNALSQIFSAFVGGVSSTITVVAQQISPTNGPCVWLSKSFQGLVLSLTLNPPAEKLQLVSGIKVRKKYFVIFL